MYQQLPPALCGPECRTIKEQRVRFRIHPVALRGGIGTAVLAVSEVTTCTMRTRMSHSTGTAVSVRFHIHTVALVRGGRCRGTAVLAVLLAVTICTVRTRMPHSTTGTAVSVPCSTPCSHLSGGAGMAVVSAVSAVATCTVLTRMSHSIGTAVSVTSSFRGVSCRVITGKIKQSDGGSAGEMAAPASQNVGDWGRGRHNVRARRLEWV
jgi:hypothetical protein